LHGLALFGAVKNDVLQLLGAQHFGFLLPEHPAYGIHNIRFATTVICLEQFISSKQIYYFKLKKWCRPTKISYGSGDDFFCVNLKYG